MRASRVAALAALVLAAGTVLPSAATASAADGPQVGVSSTYFAVSNYRILDTRVGNGAPTGKIGPDGVVKLDIRKILGLTSGATPTAVVMNVTAVDATDESFVTAYPDGGALPTVSNLNVSPKHKVTTNRVTVQVGADGFVDLYNHVGTVHLVVDLQGFYTPKGANGYPGSTFTLGTPTRLLDTRTEIGGHPGKLTGGENGVFAMDVSSVAPGGGDLVVQATVTEPTEPAHLTMYPALQDPWKTSDVNFDAGQTVTNLSYVFAGPNGLALYTNSGATHVVIDYVGQFQGHGLSGDAGNHGLFVPANPTRVLDTRTGLGAPKAKPGPGSTTRVKVTGLNGVPEGIAAVVINLTGTNADQDGHITALKAGDPVPGTSNLNYAARQDTAAMTIVPVSADGYIDLYNPHGNVDLVADVQGYYTG
ncbi:MULTISPECIES: hypothetical protein [Streptomyces]|uniref:hypothetical protein n=1 Tax=Streptomyces TaxID=1883 RepID=UPI0012FED258|nr:MULTISPECIES: hypothetical protein [Streptomyces]